MSYDRFLYDTTTNYLLRKKVSTRARELSCFNTDKTDRELVALAANDFGYCFTVADMIFYNGGHLK